MERERRQQIAEQTLFRCMSTILSKMHDIDHIPQAYEFEVSGRIAVFVQQQVESHSYASLRFESAVQSPKSLSP